MVGDPDQSIYAFRGAEARGILDFPDRCSAPRTARRRRSLALGHDPAVRAGNCWPPAANVARPAGHAAGAAAGRLREVPAAARRPGPAQGSGRGLHLQQRRAPRPSTSPRSCAAPTCATASLGRDGGAGARRAGSTIPALTRALVAAGVPVEVAGDEIPLATDPAVRPLLLGAAGGQPERREHRRRGAAAADLPAGRTGQHGDPATGPRAARRRAGRAGRQRDAPPVRGADRRRRIRQPDLLDDCSARDRRSQAARRLAGLLRQTTGRSGRAAPPRRRCGCSGRAPGGRSDCGPTRPGAATAGRRANRDLDAVCALFDIAARSEEVSGLRGVTGFLAEVEGQQIPADTLRESDLRGSAVRVLTAHRAKGLEWELVVVAGVQEGRWPDVRRRGSLLEPDRLGRREADAAGPDGAADRRGAAAVLRRLHPGPAPARGHGGGRHRGRGRPAVAVPRPSSACRSASCPGGRAGRCPCRRWSASCAASASTRTPRRACASRPPSGWPGWPTPSTPTGGRWSRPPTRPTGGACGRSARRRSADHARGRSGAPVGQPAGQRAGLPAAVVPVPEGAGRVVAQHRGELRLGGPRAGRARRPHPGRLRSELSDHLESVWDQLDFDANWLSAVERVEAEAALERFVTWQDARADLELLGTEVAFSCEVELGGERVRLTGSADRVERDLDGRIRIVDFKTSRSAPTAADVAVHDQLGVYQLAVAAGRVRRSGRCRAPARRRRAGLPAAARRPGAAAAEGLPAGVAGRRAVPGDSAGRPARTPTRRRPGCTGGSPRRPGSSAAERFDARLGPACRYCPFRASCPAQPRRRQVVA